MMEGRESGLGGRERERINRQRLLTVIIKIDIWVT